MKLHVAPSPCLSCPYRRDVPPGVWSEDEYAKLPAYDEEHRDGQLPMLAVFHCHQENATGVDTVCRGWLSVHRESPAARLAVLAGAVSVDELCAPTDVALWPSGAAAAEHGLSGVDDPPPEARALVEKLLRSRAGK